MNRVKYFIILFFIGLSVQAQDKVLKDSTLSGYDSGIKLGNPTNKDFEMSNADRSAPFYRLNPNISQPWFDWKRKLNENTGVKLSVNYTSAVIGATSKISKNNEQYSGGGVFDATINWNLINRNKDFNKGSLIFWVDSRHKYFGEVPPQTLNFETGSGTFPALKFSEWDFRVLEFYYQQRFLKNRGAFVVGKIDLADWFTYHGLMHPMRHFSDFAFSINPTVSWSNMGFGVVVGGWLDKKQTIGLVAGLNDVAGDDISTSKFLDMGWDNFFNGKFLKMIELNYSPGKDQYYFQRFSATFWHSDELLVSDDSWLQSSSSKGFTLQGTWLINNKYIPTFSFGLSDGEGANSLSKLNISMMHGWYFTSHDLFGVGLNYSESTISGEGQFLSEIFYRLTLAKTFEITPNIKAIINPALNPNKDFLGYYGIRSRISL